MDATLIKVGGPPKSGTFVRALKFKVRKLVLIGEIFTTRYKELIVSVFWLQTAFANTILDVMLAQGWQQVNLPSCSYPHCCISVAALGTEAGFVKRN